MKKVVIWYVAMVMLLLAGCGERQDGTGNWDVIEKDRYVGEYLDCHNDKANLEIRRRRDGSYHIRIGIYRMFSLNDAVGKKRDNGIEFVATAPNGDLLSGMILLYGDTATVTFTGEKWSPYSGAGEYRYHKIPDSPKELPVWPWPGKIESEGI